MKSAGAYDYLEKIQWSNGTIHNRLQHRSYHHNTDYHSSMVTSNTCECINSMIDDYRTEGWTDLLEGIL